MLSMTWSRSEEGLKRGTTTSCCIPQIPSMHSDKKRRVRPNALFDR